MKIIIAIPAYNEELILRQSIETLVAFCEKNSTDEYTIVIADNNSSDQTSAIGKALAQQYPRVSYLFVKTQGKGAAIRAAWKTNQADVYCFMDADLATDLSALPKLIDTIKQGGDVAIGSRYVAGARVKRSMLRKVVSKVYRLFLKQWLGVSFNDAPCGFKAITQKVHDEIVPKVENNGWFFDSELVIVAEKNGYKVTEVPVTWIEPRTQKGHKSRVNIFKVGLNYFTHVAQLKKRL